MNASIATGTFVDLSLALIRPSATNPRKSFDPKAMEDLEDSIKMSGLIQPILVRPIEVGGGFDTGDDDDESFIPEDVVREDTSVDGHFRLIAYELVVGSRRVTACKSIGRETICAEVRDMTDDEVREVQISENLQRADVDPLEEAEAFQELLEVKGSIPAVAARLGKEQAYVAKSLRLMALTLPSRDALRGRLIGIEHAMLLARLAETEQNAALKWCLDRNAGVKMAVEKVVSDRLERIRKLEEAWEEDRK